MDLPTIARVSVGFGCLVLATIIYTRSGEYIRRFLIRWRNEIKQITKKGDDVYDASKYALSFPARMTGSIEQTFFVILTVVYPPVAGATSVAWIVLKMWPNWEYLKGELENGKKRMESSAAHSLAYSALMGNMLSMTSAFVTGLLIRAAIWCATDGDFCRLLNI